MSKKLNKRLVIGVVSVCFISGLGYAAYPTFTIQCTDLVRENDRNPREFEKVEFHHYVRATSKLYNVIVPDKYVDWDYPEYYSGGNESMYATVFDRVSQIKDPVERAMSYFACILRFQPFSEYNTEVAWMIACKELKPIGKLMEVKKTDLKAFESVCDRLVKDYEGYLPTFVRMGRRICTSDIAL